ncbi:MAG: hypothetical protein ACOZBH_03215 [Patescibacteria group bacterium]
MATDYPEQAAISAEYGIDIADIDKQYIIPAETIVKHLKALEDFGFDKDDLIKMVIKLPAILGFTAERTNGLLQNLIDFGFDKDDVIKMVIKMPAILSCTAERSNSLLQNLIEFGFAKDDVIKMVVKLPSILGYTAERTIALLCLFEEMNFYIRENPSYLMFSPKLLRGRLIFLRSKRVTPQKKNMFLSNKQFEDMFDITRVELIELAKKHRP